MTEIKSYWGGSSVEHGAIHKLDAGTFAEWVDRYFNVPVPIRMSRAEFLAHPQRDKIKDGSFVMGASFPDGTTFRKDSNANAINAIILDVDDPEVARLIAEHPEIIVEKLHPYNCIIFCTAKHTPENPRVKVVVDVRACETKHFKRLLRHIIRLLGIPHDFLGSRESGVISQPQYRPVSFEGDDANPVLACRTKGSALDVTDLPAEEDLPEAERTYAYEGGDDSFGLAYLPIMDLTVEDIRPAVMAIDPDCDYKTWCEVVAGLRHQFRDEDMARQAFDLFESWSEGGTKFKEGEPYAKWKSFRPEATGKAPVTIRSLFKRAMTAGWSPKTVSDKIQQSIDDWINSCEDPALLMEEACLRITTMPFPNAIVEDHLIAVLRAKLKTLGRVVDKASVKKQLSATKYQKRAEKNDGEKPDWLRPFCFIGPENIFRHRGNGTVFTPTAFDNSFSRHLIVPAGEGDAPQGNGRPAILPTHFALNEVKIKVVDGVTYDPRKKGESYFTHAGKVYVNTFLQISVPKLVPEKSERAGKLLNKLLGHVIGDPVLELTILDFFAFCVQNPGIKIRWALLIQGAQGCGKGTLVAIIEAAIGPDNLKVVTAGALSSDFNDWRSGAQIVYLDELHSPGKNRFEVATKLKDAITNDKVTVNQKFQDVRCIQNVTNYVCTTNNMDALAMEDSDRRYHVAVSPIQTKDQVAALNATGIFDKIYGLIKTDPGAFRSFLMDHPVSVDFPVNGPAPETIFRHHMIAESRNRLQIEIEDLIADASQPLIGEDVIHSKKLHELTARTSANNHKPTHYLPVLGFSPYMGSKRFSINGHDTSIWVSDKFDPFFGTPDDVLRERDKEGDL